MHWKSPPTSPPFFCVSLQHKQDFHDLSQLIYSFLPHLRASTKELKQTTTSSKTSTQWRGQPHQSLSLPQSWCEQLMWPTGTVRLGSGHIPGTNKWRPETALMPDGWSPGACQTRWQGLFLAPWVEWADLQAGSPGETSSHHQPGMGKAWPMDQALRCIHSLECGYFP